MFYLDANATSRTRPEVAEYIQEITSPSFGLGNPSSVHTAGRKSRALIRKAKKSILNLISHGKKIDADLVFTSGGTEACNLIIFGFLAELARLSEEKGHIVISEIEHTAVQEPVEILENSGFDVTRVPVNRKGFVEIDKFVSAVRPDTRLVALIAANNETGAMQPIVNVARELRNSGYAGPIVSDFTQILGKTNLSLADAFDAGVSAVAISGHKIGAPAGIGAMIINKANLCHQFHPVIVGGPQEKGFRGGSENLVGALAFGKAAEVVYPKVRKEVENKTRLRELLWSLIQTETQGAFRVSPEGESCVSNTLMLGFSGCRGDDLVVALDLKGICISTGSACASGRQDFSPVVCAMGYQREQAKEVIRFSLDWDADDQMICGVVKVLKDVVQSIRSSKLEQPQYNCEAVG